ncbi:catabolic L-serine/threonine dehydratase [Xylographa bjoerkii]|nr:catabolic L-serine/threonine dehydratase [Xylographa bjoerkii]
MGSMPERELLQPWIETPLIESAALSKAAGCRIFLKYENLQPSGSFKSRYPTLHPHSPYPSTNLPSSGIGNLILNSIRSRPTSPLHFYSSSGGNAGLACVTAARSLSYPATVVVPLSTSAFMVAKIRAAGATAVLQVGASWAEADAHLRESVLAHDPNGVYVPPFDHPAIWAGASSMVREMKAQLGGEQPDAVVCSVGGGGLFCGIMEGLEMEGWGGVKVLACETEGAASLRESLDAGDLVSLPAITSIASSLGAKRVARRAFEYASGERVRSVVLNDAQAARGCWRLADDERVMVEVACGVSVAVCYEKGLLKDLVQGLGKEGKVVVVVCGGSNVSLEMLMEWRERFGGVEGVVEGGEDVPSGVTAPKG